MEAATGQAVVNWENYSCVTKSEAGEQPGDGTLDFLRPGAARGRHGIGRRQRARKNTQNLQATGHMV